LPGGVEPKKANIDAFLGQNVPQIILISGGVAKHKRRENNEIVVRRCLEGAYPLLKTVTRQHVVGIEEKNEFSSRFVDGNITAGTRALRLAFASEKENSPITLRKRSYDVFGRID
jgi:hypothetical protein